MRKHLFLSLIGFLSGLLCFLYIRFGSPYADQSISLLDVLLVGLTGIASTYTVYFCSRKLDVLFPWQSSPGKRLLIGILLNSILTFSLSYFLLYVYASLGLKNTEFLHLGDPIIIKLILITFVWVLLGSILYFGWYSYYLYAQGQVNEIKRKRKQIELQLKALKTQLSPHFLFNNLNTISSLIHKDQGLAEAFIRKLGLSYQYTLATYDKKLVSIAEELVFVESYKYLLKTRFQDQIEISIDIPESIQQGNIPPLALQMLVENAAKHNQMSHKEPLKVEIGADQKWIWVRNNKTKTPSGISSFHIGLQNINARFNILANQEIQVEDSGSFTVKLPILL